MTNLTKIIYLSQADFNTLVSGGSVTKEGVTYTYDPSVDYRVAFESEDVEGIDFPTPTSADADKVVAVNSEGKYVLVTPQSGTNVVANPTLEGSETDLTGLEVDGVKYKVPQGGGSEQHLYQHVIRIFVDNKSGWNNSIITITLLNSDDAAIESYSSLSSNMTVGLIYPASGIAYIDDASIPRGSADGPSVVMGAAMLQDGRLGVYTAIKTTDSTTAPNNRIGSFTEYVTVAFMSNAYYYDSVIQIF